MAKLTRQTVHIMYDFGARYVDVDFERIIDENPAASFIGVKWRRPTGETREVYLVTRKGYHRIKEAVLVDASRIDTDWCGICANGSLRQRKLGSHGIRMITSYSGFQELYEKLVEREEKKHLIVVTAIY
jgi:hypothetical protein